MRKANLFLIVAVVLSAPVTSTAQVTDHVSFYSGSDLGLRSFGAGFGLNVGAWGALGFSMGFGTGYYHDYSGFYRPFNTQSVHCWDDLRYDPYYDCEPFGPFWGPGYGYGGWHNPWRLGFLGWPSPRYVRSHRYAFAPFWSDYYYGWPGNSWGWYSGYDNWDWYGPGYGRYYDHPSTRVVRRTPLYGPRFKEYPVPPVYVTDNGPERPVSRAMPRLGAGPSGSVDIIGREDRGVYSIQDRARKARPRGNADAKPATPPRVRARPRADGGTNPTPQARPRSGTRGTDVAAPRARDTRTIRPGVRRPPVATSRPDTRAPSTRSAPARIRQPTPIRSVPPRVRDRSTPRERIQLPGREAPRVRSTPSRRPSPTARSFPSRMPTPRARPAPSRAPKPKARSAPSRGSAPRARPAPSRAPKPKARPAPRSSGGDKSRARRPARRPGS